MHGVMLPMVDAITFTSRAATAAMLQSVSTVFNYEDLTMTYGVVVLVPSGWLSRARARWVSRCGSRRSRPPSRTVEGGVAEVLAHFLHSSPDENRIGSSVCGPGQELPGHERGEVAPLSVQK